MAKDPAFLLYPGDYLGGTMGFSLEQHGAYFLCLILQFNSGPFTEQQARSIVGDVWIQISHKFKEKNGLFFSKRLAFEIEKRTSYCDSRRLNRLKSKIKDTIHMNNICEPYVPHMENENRNRNKDKIKELDKEKEKNTTKPPNNIAFEINGTKIPYSFYMSVLKKCNGDREMAGRVFFRAKCRATQNPIAWISKGMMKDDKGEYYAMKSIREEDEDPQAVRQWIDTVVNKYKEIK